MIIKIITIIGLLTLSLIPEYSWQNKISNNFQPNKQQSIKLSEDEQIFLKSTLSQISKDSTQKEVFNILGNPSRNVLNTKFIWEKNIGQNNQRIIVYFKSNKAYELRFDGGTGRFYYKINLESGKKQLNNF